MHPGEIFAVNAMVNVEIPGDPKSSDIISSAPPGAAAAEQHATPRYTAVNRRSNSNQTYNGGPSPFRIDISFLVV